METRVWAYPWDIARLGVNEAVRRVVDAEIDVVSLATVYHSGQVLSLVGGPPRWVFRPEGPLIDIRETQWQDENLTFSPREVVMNLAEALRQAGVGLRGWTIVNHDKRGWAPTINCYGQAMPHAACPVANWERAIQLAESLGELGVFDGLDLESVGFTSALHGAHHEIAGVQLTPLRQFLLSFCTCDACRDYFTDHLDWVALRVTMQQRLARTLGEEACDDGVAEVTQFLSEYPLVARYVASRGRLLEQLVAQMGRAAGIPVAPILMAYERRAELSWIEGLTADPRLGSLVALGYGDVQMITSDLAWLRRQGWDIERVVLGQSLLPAIAADYGAAEARIQAALALGVRRFSFYNLGLLPPQRWQWLRTLSAMIKAQGASESWD